MMRCKSCGEDMPDPEPKVVVSEKVKEIERAEQYYYLRMVRWATLLLIVTTIGGFSTCAYEKHLETTQLQAIITDPNVRIEIREEPGRSPYKTFTRDQKITTP